MNIDEILMRVGIDASGVVTGMGRVGSFVKAQTTLIMEDLKGMAGRWLGVLGIEQSFEKMKDRVMEIKHAADSTGLSVELIQGIFNKLSEDGIDPEKVLRPLAQLAGLTGDSKKFLEDTAEAYVKLNSQEERNAMLMNLGIKNWQSLIPILQEGREGIEKMSQPGPFKLDRQELNDITTLWEGIKGGGNAIIGVLAQITAAVGALSRNTAIGLRWFITGESIDVLRKRAKEADKLSEYQKAENAAESEGFTLAQKRLDLEDKMNKLLAERTRLQNQIADRDKLGVSELADRARKLLGTDRLPRGLNAINTVTPAMRAALQISDLEDQAKVAQAFGRSDRADALQSRADAIRANTPALKSTERNPNARMEQQLQILNEEVGQIRAKIQKIPSPA